jgi:diguanylate cyclase (GGDEF)-like protein
MKIPRLTIIRQMTFGYLILILFSLGAIGYSLQSLKAQNRGAAKIVTVDIQLQNVAHKLRSVLLALDRLEPQAVILRQPDLIDLYTTRSNEVTELWESLPPLPERAESGTLRATFTAHQQTVATMRALLDRKAWTKAKNYSTTTLVPLRQELIGGLDQLASTSSVQVNVSLKQLAEASRSAAQIVLALIVVGILLSALVILSLSASIRRSIKHFVEAIHTIGTGAFELDMDLPQDDEFSALAGEFRTMGRKLREIEQQSLDANPLTGLPGNLVIEREVERRIASGVTFAHGFADLDHFKAYNDRYGYRKGSEVLAIIGDIVRAAVELHGTPEDLIGHVGGDDYIFLTPPEHADKICESIIQETDQICPEFYSDEDRDAGHFMAKDRFGVERQFPLLSISIAVVCSDRFENPTGLALGRECARMKEHLKKLPGSRYLVDRRRGN